MMKKGQKEERRREHSMALIKYERDSRGLIPIPSSPRVEKKAARHKRLLARANTPMSLQTFIVSHLALLIISLLFLGGLYFVLNKDHYGNTIVGQYLPITQKPASFKLEINNPDDETLTYSRSVVVSGTTSPNASVVIVALGTTAQYTGVDADNSGAFRKTIALSPGLNTLEISSFDDKGNSKTIDQTIYYSEEVLQ